MCKITLLLLVKGISLNVQLFHQDCLAHPHNIYTRHNGRHRNCVTLQSKYMKTRTKAVIIRYQVP